MYCNKCGNKNASDANFCVSCGGEINHQNTNVVEHQYTPTENQNNQVDLTKEMNNQNQIFQQQPMSQNFNNVDNQKINKLGGKAKKIGIISIVLVFIIQVLVIPLAIVGLVFGLKYKKQTNQKNIGIILCIISIALAIPIYMFYSKWLLNPINHVVGTWNCAVEENSEDYIFTLKLNTNKTFTYSKYGDAENNSIMGKIQFEDLKKTNPNNSHRYYNIKLISDDEIIDGKQETGQITMEFQMAVGTPLSDARDTAALMNSANYNAYYCVLQK